MNNKGFTLIELLVVVLILGILATVALPQYQKAVWKSRNVQLKTAVKSVVQAQDAYAMANGNHSISFDELSIDLPLTAPKTDPCQVGHTGTDSIRQGKDFQIVLNSSYGGTNPGAVVGVWTEGPYKCAGFTYYISDKHWLCLENTREVAKLGDFCQKIEKGTLVKTGYWYYYDLP